MYRLSCLILACAAGVLASGDVKKAPQYESALDSLRKAEVLLQSHLTAKKLPVTNSARHYALILGAVGDASRNAGTNCLTNHTTDYYNGVDTGVPLAWSDPVELSSKITDLLKNVKSITNDLRDLVDSTCMKNVVSNKQLQEKDCNYIVDIFINDHPRRYLTPAKLLLALGPLSEFYLQNNNNFQIAANSYNVVHLLLSEYSNEFIDNLPKAGLVYSLLNNLQC